MNDMTPEEFWNKYINENILDIFDITCDFFSGELPGEFLEKYDVGEVIVETKGHHTEAKEFERVLKFLRLLKDKQPELYMENFQYLDDFLVDYYCFHGDDKQVEPAFTNFINYPVQDYDQYFSSFKKLLFYQYTDLIDKAITENFDTVAGSDKLIGAPEYDLAICKLYSELDVFLGKKSHVLPKNYIEGGEQEKKGPDLSALEDSFDTPGEYEEFQENFDETDEYEGSQENIDDTDEYKPAKTWPKVGRNDPCPCGSGKKYKKCCL